MLIQFLKLFGAPLVAKELATLIREHVKDYSKLNATFAAGAKGCADKNADEVAQALTDGLFSIS